MLHGRDEIRARIEDVTARDMTHAVGRTVADDGGAAFSVACRYPGGTNVLCVTVLELRAGAIAGQTVVQVWDESNEWSCPSPRPSTRARSTRSWIGSSATSAGR